MQLPIKMKELWLTIWAALSMGSLYAQKTQLVAQAYLELKVAAYKGDIKETSVSGQILLDILQGESISVNTKKSLQELVKSNSIEKQRTLLGDISEPIWGLLKTSKTVNELFLVQCPMKKAFWIDDSKSFKNPFYGKQMASCGKISDQF